jgi:tetratricopeptide (TPR) repeat protein
MSDNIDFSGTELHRVGEVIGEKYKVIGLLGKGGFGLVYLVHSLGTRSVYAMKTFQDEYLISRTMKRAFHKEASIWVAMDKHPHLTRAYFVEEIHGRLYIAMEYIAPDENGLNSLEGYLRSSPPDLLQTLRWAIQFCRGMQYAYSRGLKSHRDIKPANILIGCQKIVKITDFGIAGFVGSDESLRGIRLNFSDNRVRLSLQTAEGAIGTPTHMAPEQFVNAAYCDERSDVYSFGVVLYQMRASGKLPFLALLPRDNSEKEAAGFWASMRRMHAESPCPNLNSRLYPIIHRCLEKHPGKRYQTFSELCLELETLLKEEFGEVAQMFPVDELEAADWNWKGMSLERLGYSVEALLCYDRAIEIDPKAAGPWLNKAASLVKLRRHEEASHCLDEAFEIQPRATALWVNKGNSLYALGRYKDAIECFNIVLDDFPEYGTAWQNKGTCLNAVGEYKLAIVCFERAIEIDPKNVGAWKGKAKSLQSLGRHEEEIKCYDKSLEIDPGDAAAWHMKGYALHMLARLKDALGCYEKAIEIDPGNALVWQNKATCLNAIGEYEQAVACFDKAIEIDPKKARAWNGKAKSLQSLGRYEEEVRCYDKSLEIDSGDSTIWYDKGCALDMLAQPKDALSCYEKAIKLHPNYGDAYCNRGVAKCDLGDREGAIEDFNKVIELQPDHARPYCNRGAAKGRLGDREGAIEDFNKAIKLQPDYADAYYNRGISYSVLGRKGKALDDFMKAMDLGHRVDQELLDECKSGANLEGKQL